MIDGPGGREILYETGFATDTNSREVLLNPRKDARKNRITWIFLALSLGLHFAVLAFLYFTPSFPPAQPPKAVFVDLNALPPADAIEPRQKSAQKQVVESEQAESKSEPKEAKYLGERNQDVAKETKAKTVDSFKKGSAPVLKGNGAKNFSLSDLAPKNNIPAPPTQAEIDGWKAKQKNQARLEKDSGRPGAPTSEEVAATNDYLKDVSDGDRTLLSTKEFVYFGYYRRIRQRLEVAWNSKLRAAIESYVTGGRKLASDKDYVTSVVVVMDANGTITGVQLMQKSGARDLDQAAVDAFNEAGPFPDPPSGLVDKNGEIKIPWSFILQSG